MISEATLRLVFIVQPGNQKLQSIRNQNPFYITVMACKQKNCHHQKKLPSPKKMPAQKNGDTKTGERWCLNCTRSHPASKSGGAPIPSGLFQTRSAPHVNWQGLFNCMCTSTHTCKCLKMSIFCGRE